MKRLESELETQECRDLRVKRQESELETQECRHLRVERLEKLKREDT